MKCNTSFPRKCFFVFSLANFPICSTHAAIESFDIYALAGVQKDSNVFRTADNEEDDTITHLGAGMDLDWKVSRQHFLLNALADRSTYDEFSELDHTRYDAGATWNWQVGNLWSGDLGYKYKQELASFEQFLTRQEDTKTSNRGFFEAGYQIHPDLELIGLLDFADVEYDQRDRLNRKTDVKQLEVQYRNTRNTRVGVRGRFTDTDLDEPGIVNGLPVSNDYSSSEISGVFYWEGSGKSGLEVRMGYTDLNYDDLDERDFDGYTGRLTHHWLISGKTSLATSAWRETDSQNDEISTYVLSQGISLDPVWLATAKITVRGTLSYVKDEYKGDDITAIGGQQRDDKTWFYGLGVSYKPIRNISLSLNYRYATRDSTVAIADYDDQQVSANIRLRY